MKCRTRSLWLWLVALTSLVTVLNAWKPLTIDDAIYHSYAEQIARAPADPYGFELAGVRPANHSLAPPAFTYWWAGAIRLFGDDPLWWKLSLFPLILLLMVALAALARRFVGGMELPVVVMLALSPAFLPSWNLMLDMPALALELAALAIYLRALERRPIVLALLAGGVLGVAMQTKYTAFVMLPVIVWHAWLQRRPGAALTTVLTAVLLFAGWETWVAHRYGESHFLFHLSQRSTSLLAKLRLTLPLLSLVGGVAAWLIPFALSALGLARRTIWLSSAGVLAVTVILAVVPESCQVWRRNQEGVSRMELAGVLFGLNGLVVGSLLVLVGRALLKKSKLEESPVESKVISCFLLGWIMLEIVGYFALSPFPAVRRVLGVLTPLTFLVARLATRYDTRADRSWQGYRAAALSALFGLAFQGVDCWDARVHVRAAEDAARWIHDRDQQARIWCLGEFGFPFYGERAGMTPMRPESVIQPGDWLVWTDFWAKVAGGPPIADAPLLRWTWEDCLPLRTQRDYYNSGRPLRHHEGPRCTVNVARVPYSPGQISAGTAVQ